MVESLKHLEKEHFGLPKFECDICNDIYFKKIDLSEHSKIHLLEAGNQISCKVSEHSHKELPNGKSVSKLAKLNRPQISLNVKYTSSHKCDNCKKNFSEKHLLFLHIEKAHVNKRLSKCGLGL